MAACYRKVARHDNPDLRSRLPVGFTPIGRPGSVGATRLTFPSGSTEPFTLDATMQGLRWILDPVAPREIHKQDAHPMVFAALRHLLRTPSVPGPSAEPNSLDSVLIPRRAFTAAVAAICYQFTSYDAAAEPVQLEQASVSQPLQIRTVVEVEGQLKVNGDGRAVSRLPLKVQGDLTYTQHPLQTPQTPQATSQYLREYRDAQAKIQIGDQAFPVSLGDERRLVVVEARPSGTYLAPYQGHFTRDELDLLDVQGDSLVLGRLLPPKPVNPGDSWEPSHEALAALLNLDAVTQSEVRCKLVEFKDQVAQMELAGKLSGAIGGVATELDVKAKYSFDRQQQLVTWLAMALREDRSIGHAEPGLDVQARVRVVVGPIEDSDTVAVSTPTEDPHPPESTALLAFESSKGAFSLLHERGWRVMVDRHDVTVLRMVRDGDLIGQCNISKLPNEPKDKQLSLEGFQQEIRKALGESFGQVTEANEVRTDTGLRMLRVVAGGVASELPMVWVYYHLANDDGRRAGIVFTLEPKYLERFGELDHTLTSTFRFEPIVEDQPKAADPAPRAAATPKSTTKR